MLKKHLRTCLASLSTPGVRKLLIMAREYRFFTTELDNENLEKNVALSDRCEAEIFGQMVKVLRIKPGDRVVLMGRDKVEFLYDTVLAHKKEVHLKFISKKINENELDFNLGLILCLPNKPDKLSMILQKAVELGVSEVILVSGEYSQMKHELKEERLQRIMKEAAEQSERGYVPVLKIDGTLDDFLNGDWVREESANIYVAMEREDSKGLLDILDSEMEKKEPVNILIGPEGGFSEDEKQAIKDHQIECFSLGKRILRMETAAIVALGMAAVR